jgi:hypothetical protein
MPWDAEKKDVGVQRCMVHRYSLRAYAAILYRRWPEGLVLTIQGMPVQPQDIRYLSHGCSKPQQWLSFDRGAPQLGSVPVCYFVTASALNAMWALFCPRKRPPGACADPQPPSLFAGLFCLHGAVPCLATARPNNSTVPGVCSAWMRACVSEEYRPRGIKDEVDEHGFQMQVGC